MPDPAPGPVRPSRASTANSLIGWLLDQPSRGVVWAEEWATTRTEDQDLNLEAAGWTATGRVGLHGTPSDYQTVRWTNLRTIMAARNQILVGTFLRSDPAGTLRHAERGNQPPVARSDRPGARRVLVVGDTGDGSEAAAVASLAVAMRRTQRGVWLGGPLEAVMLASDLVYPAGRDSEFADKFSLFPNACDGVPLLAVPGNHDWDDGALDGFSHWLCGATERVNGRRALRHHRAGLVNPFGLVGWALSAAFWHPWTLRGGRTWAAEECLQQRPYWCYDLGGVRFIGLDTGHDGTIDAEQFEWLERCAYPGDEPEQASEPMPKVLITGKPLVVNGRYEPCMVVDDPQRGTGRRSVDEVVRDPRAGFVISLGGDIHNYQRYAATVTTAEAGAERVVPPYVVCGGGGVFLSQTFALPPIRTTRFAAASSGEEELLTIRENTTTLFPTRAHSRLLADRIVRANRWRLRLVVPITLATWALLGLAAAAVDAGTDTLPWLAVAVLVAGALVATSGNCRWNRPRIVSGLLVATLGVVGLAIWRLDVAWNEVDVNGPSARGCLALLVAGVAINISAQPIRGRALAVVVALGVAAGYLALDAVHTIRWPLVDAAAAPSETWAGIEPGQWAAGVLAVGVALFAAGSLPIEQRRTRQWLSLAGALLCMTASVLIVASSAPGDHTMEWLYPLVFLAPLAYVAWTWAFLRLGRSVDQATDDTNDQLQPPAPRARFQAPPHPATRFTTWLAGLVARRQRLFSMFEAASGERLDATSTIKWGSPHDQPHATQPHVPLYRSFVEIEYGDGTDGQRTFYITAFAVTGEGDDPEPETDGNLRPIDARQVLVDAFAVTWRADGIHVHTDEPPDEQHRPKPAATGPS